MVETNFENTMTDDEVLDKFFEENELELRRIERRRKIRKAIRPTLIGIGLGTAVYLAIIGGFKYRNNRLAVEAQEEKAVAQAQADHDHAVAQYAHVIVEYAADGHAVGCLVTQKGQGDPVTHFNTPIADVYISNWKGYKDYAKLLRFDPTMCEVWNWPGKDP